MKYEVTFSCGHTGTVQLYGKGDERERKIRYFEEYGVCSECYKERRAIEAEIGCKHVTMFYRTYKDVIFSYKKDQTKPACNGYCEKAYTAEDAEFARIQIEHLLKSCQ